MGLNWGPMKAVMLRDVRAVRRQKAVVWPMLFVPVVLLVLLPASIGLASNRSRPIDISGFLDYTLTERLAAPIRALPAREQVVVLVMGYLLAPLFLIVPLMVSAVMASDSFAGEKERKTIETLMHLPISDRDLYVAKFLGAFVPTMAISWGGFAAFVLVANTTAWPVMHRLFLPTRLWMVVILWVAPAVAALGLGIMVRVSARARTAQEANQLGGTVILPLVILCVWQTTGVLLLGVPVAMLTGAVIWVIAIVLNVQGARRFSRESVASRL